jgi:hypothetical protein
LPVITSIPAGIGGFYSCWYSPLFWIIIQVFKLKKAPMKKDESFGFGSALWSI